MASPSDTVHKHAITSPAFDASRVHRERLVDALHANVPRKLTVVAAPAGYGKTTLLADFTAHTELPVCWVRLTEADTDLMRLASILAGSLQRRFRRLRGLPDLKALAGSSPAALARAFALAIDSKVSESFVVVMDDVHLVNRARPVLEFLDALIDGQPEQMTLITAGREVPEVSLAKLMAEADLAGLGPHDLAFDADEVIALGRETLGVDLDPQQAERLLGETRGWVTGILLSGVLSAGMFGDLPTGPRPMVYEYLALVVLNRQPDELRRFMLDSAVMPVMTAEMCNQVLQRTDSDRQLASLVRSGLFVTATEESPRTYEFHPQFRVFLLETLGASDPQRLRQLRMRAAAYMAANDAPEHAVDLYLSSGAGGRAAQLAERHAQAMYRAGRTETLARWVERLGALQVPIPRSLYYWAMALIDQGNLDAAAEIVEQGMATLRKGASRALQAGFENLRGWIAYRRGDFIETRERAVSAGKLVVGRGDRLQRAIASRLLALAEYGSKGDMAEAANLLSKAIELYDPQQDAMPLASAMAELSMVQTALGMSHEAYATSLRTIEILKGNAPAYHLATAFNNLAVDLHLRGRFLEAMERFSEAAKHARQSASPHREAVVLFGQADLFSDLDLALQAAELYAQALSIATQLDNVSLLSYGCVQTSVLHRRRGGGGLAHEWLRRAISLDAKGLPHTAVDIQLAALQVTAAPKAARTRLEGLLKEKNASLEAGEKAAVLYFLARASFAADEPAAARAALDRALTWTGSHGTEQILAAEMAFDPAFRDFARRVAGGNPVLAVVLQRIETMRGVAQQYLESVPEAAEAPSKIEVIGLGRSTIRLGGRQLTEVKKLAREVYFFLVDQQGAERDVLVETFWPQYNPGRQTSNLHTAIYSLRRALGKEAILQSGTEYNLNPDIPIHYDVAEFTRAAEVALALPPGDPRRLFALTAAITSYGGQFLHGADADWVIERRRRLEMTYLDLLAIHAEEALVRDQPQRAVTTLRQALEIDPLRDDTNLRLLEALGRLGRRSEVVAHYQRYVRLMADELGLDPPEQFRQLYARLIG